MNGAEAKQKLEGAIQKNISTAGAVVDQVMSVQPYDQVVRARAITFHAHGEGAGPGRLLIATDDMDNPLGVHNHALRQMGEKAGIPASYVDSLSSGDAWRRQLLAGNFQEHFSHMPATQRHLVRSVGGEVRGFLSDKFRRLDSRPILSAFLDEVQAVGAVPYSGHASPVRCSLKVIIPTVRELGRDGEVVALGAEFSNSDYGAGSLAIRLFLLRITCLNGATLEDLMHQVHLGGRLAEEIEFSQKTYELDTKTTVSAVRDMARGAFDRKRQESLLSRVEMAQDLDVPWSQLKGKLSQLSKDELRRVEESYNGPDVINLPPGANAWRASNALSWVAQMVEGAERRLELEKLAGSLLPAPAKAA